MREINRNVTRRNFARGKANFPNGLAVLQGCDAKTRTLDKLRAAGGADGQIGSAAGALALVGNGLPGAPASLPDAVNLAGSGFWVSYGSRGPVLMPKAKKGLAFRIGSPRKLSLPCFGGEAQVCSAAVRSMAMAAGTP